MSVPISQRADDLIVACEVSSKATYEKKYRRPEWPGVKSGITIAIGYDLGYATATKVKSDWGDRLPGPMIDAMLGCVGATGESAHGMLSGVRNRIDVSWADAIHVYEHVDIPEWTDRVCRAIPKADHLAPDCIGALTSLAYNRGASFQMQGDRYREMRAIRSHIIAGEFELVDDEIRAMKRLWPNVRGLLVRRDEEAKLWNLGLTAPAPVVKSKPNEAPAPLAPIPKSGGPEAGTAAAGAGSTGTAAVQAAQSGVNPWLVGALVVGGIIVTVGTVAYIRYHRSQPLVARAKG